MVGATTSGYRPSQFISPHPDRSIRSKTYFTHRVRSHRVFRQGPPADPGPLHHWPLLCRRLESDLSGQRRVLPKGQSWRLKPNAAQRLLECEAGRRAGTAEEASSEDLQTVGSFGEIARPRSIGVEQVGCWALSRGISASAG